GGGGEGGGEKGLAPAQASAFPDKKPGPPAGFGRAGGDGLDDPRREGGKRGQSRQRVGPAQSAKRRSTAVQTKLPRGRVPLRRDEVAPVLDDQPKTDERRQRGREPEVFYVEERADGKGGKDPQPDLLPVDSAP